MCFASTESCASSGQQSRPKTAAFGSSMRRKVLGKAEQHRSEEIWMAAAQVQVKQPFFFSIGSFHMRLFSWTSRLSPPGNLLGMKSQYCICSSRISTCPSGLSDSWAAEHPEIQGRLTAHWGGEVYGIHTLCLMNPKIVRPAVQMICICTVCPACSEGVCSTLYSQNIYMVQMYVLLLGKQDKQRGFLHIPDVFVEEGTASV